MYQRIVSLVPSLTELVIDLGIGDRLIGRTRFCVHPEEVVKDIPIVGGTKSLNLDSVRELDPDYIIANKEENRKVDIEKLSEDYEVRLTDISTIEDAMITIHDLGADLDLQEKAEELTGKISGILEERPDEPPINTAYLIWRTPWMTVGADTYIHDVMDHWKLHNIFEDRQRYPTIALEELERRSPQLILLSSEPFPFSEKHTVEVEEACPGSRVLLVNGEWFSWYGSRMVSAFREMNVWRKAIA